VDADVPRAGDPHAVAVGEDVLEGPAELADAIRPARHEGMQRGRADERLAARLREHLVELVHEATRLASISAPTLSK
jgi:hypothetical protein